MEVLSGDENEFSDREEEQEEEEEEYEEEGDEEEIKKERILSFYSENVNKPNDIETTAEAVLKGDKTARSSQIFLPYRALGLIAGNTPLVVYHRKNQSLVSVAIGKVVQTFDCKKLSLLFVTHSPHSVRVLALMSGLLFVASKNEIYVWHRNSILAVLRSHEVAITHMFVIGETLLFSLDESGELCSWSVSESHGISLKSSFNISSEQEEEEGSTKFVATCMIHPSTYLNKVLFGSEDGRLRLWNISKKKLIYEFKGWGVAVRCVAQSPALDLVGIGLADGRIFIHNLKTDRSLMCFQQVSACTAISFRTDGPAFMMTASATGEVSVWNLKNRKLESVMRNVHPGHPVTSMHCFPGQPIMITSSPSNSIRMWIFDQSDNSGRLLRERTGHHAPPTLARYHGTENTRFLLSAGTDQALRFFHMTRDSANCELSQGHIESLSRKRGVSEGDLRLPIIIGMASRFIREREWDNIVTIHENCAAAFTWNFLNKKKGKHTLRSQSGAKWRACEISICGNYAILGSSNGEIEMFNLQSGIFRGAFLQHSENAHSKAVTGLVAEGLGKLIISSSLDGFLKFWNLSKKKLESEINVGVGINFLRGNEDGSLVAAVCDDLVVRVYDVDLNRLVRHYSGHLNKITDLAFSDDGRWIITSSMDQSIRVWDIPSACLIDWFQVEKAVTSLAFSPAGNYLVTTHVDDLGVYLWASRAYFGKVFLKPTSLQNDVGLVSMPNVLVVDDEETEKEELIVSGGSSSEDEEGSLKRTKRSKKPLKENHKRAKLTKEDEGLISLSGRPSNQWRNLPNLDVIRLRNKPKEAPSKPEKAPFFLDLMSTQDSLGNDSSSPGESKFLASSSLPKSKFYKMLDELPMENWNSTHYFPIVEYLVCLGPSAVELEFEMLHKKADSDYDLALKFFLQVLEEGSYFDYVESWLNLFLKLHLEEIGSKPSLAQLCTQVEKKQKKEWVRLEGMFQNTLCLVNLMSGMGFNG